MGVRSLQSNIKTSFRDMTQYSLFLGGLDVTNKALLQYDPLRTGYARIFFVKKPAFLEKLFYNQGEQSDDWKKFKSFWHVLEYGFISIDGIQNTSLEMEGITGGYAGRTFEVPTLSKDETNALTLKVYESAGSPIREMIDLWITGIADPYTGLSHYHGVLGDVPLSQANHTAEAIYVQTDPTGNSNNIEYACMLCNMIPKTVKKDHFNYESGQHPITQVDLDFTATKYESVQINEVAKKLVSLQSILSNYTYFQSEYMTTSEDGKTNTFDATITNREAVTTASWTKLAAARTS